jgi:hypothetical protein
MADDSPSLVDISRKIDFVKNRLEGTNRMLSASRPPKPNRGDELHCHAYRRGNGQWKGISTTLLPECCSRLGRSIGKSRMSRI